METSFENLYVDTGAYRVKPISFSRAPAGFPIEKMNVYEH